MTLFEQLAQVARTGPTLTETELNGMLSPVRGLAPTNPTEALLAAQMAAVHNATVLEAASIRHAIRNARHDASVPDKARLRVQVSSLFLRDAHRYLTSDPHGRERLALISGTISDDDVRVMSRMLNVDMDEASPAYVRAAPQATHKAIVQLVERDGHPLHAMWHSHIMRGANGTRPSGVDIANQERFCAMGWDEVIGGIFSLDGFVRLFSTARDFAVSTYGNGVDIITDNPREKVLKLAIGA